MVVLVLVFIQLLVVVVDVVMMSVLDVSRWSGTIDEFLSRGLQHQ